jgi:citrate lyase gamma subunit
VTDHDQQQEMQQQFAVTEQFGEKIKHLMGDINDNIDQTYQRLDGIEVKIKVNDELAKEYYFHF